MSYHCFFGLEIKGDGVPVTPILPPETSLVITQCAIHSYNTSKPQAHTNKVTLYVQSHNTPQRIAVGTLSVTDNVFFMPLQLIFSQAVSFSLVPAYPEAGDKSVRQKNKKRKSSETDTADAAAEASEEADRVVVHLTGYYESVDEEPEDEDDIYSEEEEEENME